MAAMSPPAELETTSGRRSSQVAMPSIFIAVQCCQCSTMQVKQQAKAGNKWVCAVCNEKQSVRKIFARGPMAKDIRKFVQEFNMSRKFAEEQALHSSLNEVEDIQTSSEKKRRSDWSEYVDLPENCSLNENEKQEQTTGEDELERRIVTEFPEELFKKPKLKKQHHGSYNENRDHLLKPVFTKMNKTSGNTNHHVGRKQNDDHMETNIALKLNSFMPKDREEPRSSQMACTSGASKWSKYLTEVEDSDQNKRCKKYAIDEGSQINYILEAMSNDEEVIDDIHPDFK